VRQVLLGEHHEARPRVPVFENPAGISVTPGSRLVIEFLSRQSAGTASVRITDSPELTIQAPNGAATFTSDVDRVAVNNHGSASFEIEVPRVAAWVEIRVEGVPSFRKQGARVTLGRETARDAYAVPLTPP
jgi:limonene-1,2-epoxide hydrolase